LLPWCAEGKRGLSAIGRPFGALHRLPLSGLGRGRGVNETQQADTGRDQRGRHTVQRISVRASFDDPSPELERARRAAEQGDTSWQRWLDEYHSDQALIAQLEVRVDLERAGLGPDTITVDNRGIWLERRADPPLIEAQVAELAGKDFDALERGLRERGLDVRDAVLHKMYVHVELANDLRAALSAGPLADEQRRGSAEPVSRVGDTPP
jgi:hypothetical protein